MSRDEDIVDAELVEPPSPEQIRADKIADFFGLDRARFWDGLLILCGDDTARLVAGLTKVEQGLLEPIGFNVDNTPQFVKGQNA